MTHDISFSGYSAAASHEADMVAAMQVMQQIKPHMMEYAAESIFMYTTYSRGGCRHAPYTPICASGPNGATLHYGHAASPNGEKPLDSSCLNMRMYCPLCETLRASCTHQT